MSHLIDPDRTCIGFSAAADLLLHLYIIISIVIFI